ncbi:MAG TPA: BatD family protein [Candidatus Eisenbacteria bacterium]
MTGSSARALAAAVIFALASAPIQLGLPPAAFGGGSPSGRISIDATLDRDQVAPDEVVNLTVLVRGEGLALPTVSLPVLPGVAVERAGDTQNFSIVNGRVERTSTTVYRLIPHRIGLVQIPPLRISAGGERASTSPLTLTVTRSAASKATRTPAAPPAGGARAGRPSGGSPELFVKATVDRPRVFWNQQLILRLTLYSRVDLLGDVDWKPPSTSGFWTEGLGPSRQGRATVSGVEYATLEIPTALFPTRTGTLTVGSARIRCRVARVIQPPDPWSMLAQPDVVAQDVALTTDPLTIVVDPLPRGAPSGFQGAVGDFHLALRVDGMTAGAGEPIPARATIRGTGNVSTIRDPEIRARGASRQYVAGSSTRIDRNGDRLVGEREIDVAFVADQPGILEILPVKFVWFDPEANRYRAQSSERVKVTVLPGTAAEPGPGRVQPGGPAIAAPRTTQGPFGTLTLDPPAGSAVLLTLSALAYGAAVATGRARGRRLRDPRRVRLRSIQRILERDLSRAQALASRNQPAAAVVLAEQALRAGVGLRYDAEVAGLARTERIRTLKSRGAADAEIRALESLFDSLGAIAYAPPETRGTDAKQAIREVKETLERFYRELLP